ncbi:MAG: SDR family oxidoreductase [Candidatus Latescibacteria bacterium]|nr:SDR family oxidoreductase [bacterium]MBD3423059.1 SDR family oxidoreductase [Candidatus Latescibacterota bacterium]
MAMHDGKNALITGGTRGIGLAVAVELAEEGAAVALNYRSDSAQAEEAVSMIEAKGGRALSMQADITEPKEIKRMFTEVREQLGSLDYFISNAVSGVLGPAERIGRFGWKRTMETNARAFMLCVQQGLKVFNPEGGSIVALSSVGSRRVLPGYAGVGASKAALEALVRYFGRELAPRGINVNAVSGGPVETRSLDYFPEKDEIIDDWVGKTPAGRLGRPEDIARVVSFLLSDKAAWIRGQTITADGGMTL